MTLFFIIFTSIIAGLAVVTFLLYLFTKKVLKNNNNNISLMLVILLVAQFILGMLSNLYVTIPKTKSYEVYHSFGSVSIHTANALFLLIFSIFYAINAHKSKKYPLLSILGVVSIVIATIGGVSFVNSAGKNDTYSLIMAVGFIIAFLVYTNIAFAEKSKQKKLRLKMSQG